jgi:hypothetical protein
MTVETSPAYTLRDITRLPRLKPENEPDWAKAAPVIPAMTATMDFTIFDIGCVPLFLFSLDSAPSARGLRASARAL